MTDDEKTEVEEPVQPTEDFDESFDSDVSPDAEPDYEAPEVVTNVKESE